MIQHMSQPFGLPLHRIGSQHRSARPPRTATTAAHQQHTTDSTTPTTTSNSNHPTQSVLNGTEKSAQNNNQQNNRTLLPDNHSDGGASSGVEFGRDPRSVRPKAERCGGVPSMHGPSAAWIPGYSAIKPRTNTATRRVYRLAASCPRVV